MSCREIMRELTTGLSVPYILQCLADICQEKADSGEWLDEQKKGWQQCAEEIRQCAQRTPRT